MTGRRIRLLVVTTAALLAGCGVRLANFHDYRGDGSFTAHPAPSVICRDGYTVDLGAVDLTMPGAVTHQLDGLPPVEATIGLALERKIAARGTHDAAVDLRRPSALIEVSLQDDLGRIVLSRHERLSEWTQSIALDDADHAYLYRRGTQIEVPVAPGTVRVERFPIGHDDSWGTYFMPRRGAHYTLHFAVEEPDADLAGAGSIDFRLQVNGVAGCL